MRLLIKHMYQALSEKTVERLAGKQEVKLLTEYLSDVRGITPFLCISRDAPQLIGMSVCYTAAADLKQCTTLPREAAVFLQLDLIAFATNKCT